MAARPTALRAVTKLASTSTRRNLHITGPATFPSTILTETRSGSSRAKDAADASKRPSIASNGSEAPASRQFNTSRSLKAVNDTSTIDFAYLPDFGYDAVPNSMIRVPLLPDTHYSGANVRAIHESDSEETLKPLINLISADSTHIHTPSAMSEVTDNATLAFEGLGSTSGAAASGQEEHVGKQLWNGLLDDIFGEKKK